MNQSIDPRTMEEPLDLALAMLFNHALLGSKWSSAVEISHTLRDDYGISLHWRTVGTLLDKVKALVTRKKKNKRWHYSLLEAGARKVGKPSSGIHLVDPRNAVQNIVTLHDLLSNLEGNIDVCDAYLDASTIEHLDSCAKARQIRILTHNVRDTGRLRQLVSAFCQSDRQLEIRSTSKSVLHDRYIYDNKKLFILGASLNGYGKKQSFIIAAGTDFRAAMQSVFATIWKAAVTWPES